VRSAPSRIGRRVGVSAGASAGVLAGAGFGLYFGFLGLLIVWGLGGDVGAYIGLFGVLPVCVLGGAWLGARLFLRFRAFANRLRLRHARMGAFAWVLGSALLVLVAGLGAVLAAVIVYGVFD
jgi:hypothetical protein